MQQVAVVRVLLQTICMFAMSDVPGYTEGSLRLLTHCTMSCCYVRTSLSSLLNLRAERQLSPPPLLFFSVSVLGKNVDESNCIINVHVSNMLLFEAGFHGKLKTVLSWFKYVRKYGCSVSSQLSLTLCRL